MSEPPPGPAPARRGPRDLLGCWLPRRWRRWWLILPLDALGLLLALALGVALLACRVDGAPYFLPGAPPDVESQFAHLGQVLAGSGEAGPDIARGYSTLCGWSSEWRPIFCAFYAMCLAERAAADPAFRPQAQEQLERCARAVLRLPADVVDPGTLAAHLATREYGSNPIITGYEGVVLGLRRQAGGDARYDPALRACADALAEWLERALTGPEPASFWTSDQALQVYAIWLADRAQGGDRTPLLARWEAAMRARFLDPDGLLISEVATHPDRVLTAPCGSSLAWTVIFLADPLPGLAREQYLAFCARRERRLLSLGASLEHASMWELGDTNSGPLILGFSPSATGFALGAHKLQGDPDRFTRALRVFELFGQPRRSPAGHLYYHLGNAMGDAILLYGKVARPRR